MLGRVERHGEVMTSAVAPQDLKPENLMMFNGRLKLIDVDGCVPIDSEVPRGRRDTTGYDGFPLRLAPVRSRSTTPPFPSLHATAHQSGPGGL